MRLRCSLSVFYHGSDFFTTSLFYLYLHSDFLANIENQNQTDYLYKINTLPLLYPYGFYLPKKLTATVN